MLIELASYLPTFLLHTQAKGVRVCKNDLVQAGGVDHQLVVIGVWSSQEINKNELQALLQLESGIDQKKHPTSRWLLQIATLPAFVIEGRKKETHSFLHRRAAHR
jgi:hypothetical protein